jgi:hypothetical protein
MSEDAFEQHNNHAYPTLHPDTRPQGGKCRIWQVLKDSNSCSHSNADISQTALAHLLFEAALTPVEEHTVPRLYDDIVR